MSPVSLFSSARLITHALFPLPPLPRPPLRKTKPPLILFFPHKGPGTLQRAPGLGKHHPFPPEAPGQLLLPSYNYDIPRCLCVNGNIRAPHDPQGLPTLPLCICQAIPSQPPSPRYGLPPPAFFVPSSLHNSRGPCLFIRKCPFNLCSSNRGRVSRF